MKKATILVEKSFFFVENKRKFQNETATLYDQFDHTERITSIFNLSDSL